MKSTLRLIAQSWRPLALSAMLALTSGTALAQTPCPFSVTAQGPTGLVAPGQTIHLSVSGAPVGASYAWVGPNGFSSSAAAPSLTNAQFANSGNYSVGVTHDGCTSVSTVVVSVGPTWNWARRAGGTTNEGVGSMVRDAAGNLYLTGWFTGTASFGNTSLTSAGNADAFVAKLDAAGNWLWVQRAGGSGNEQGTALGVDAGGNVYVTGQAGAGAVFGASTLSNGGMFVARLDAAGNWLWSTATGGTAPVVESTALTLDGNGNAMVSGRFGDPTNAATGATAVFGAVTLNNAGLTDAFVAKINAAGAWQAAVRAGNTGLDGATGIAADAAGNAFVTGYFTSANASFGAISVAGSSPTRDNLFVARLTAAGAWQWARHVGTTTGNGGSSVAIDAMGVGYVLGSYTGGPATFGSTTLNGGNMFVGRISSSGVWQWAASASVYRGGVQSGNLLTVDAGRNVFVTGHFYQTSTFGSSTLVKNYHYEPNVFLARLNATGQWQWATVAGGYTVGDGLGVAEFGGNVSVAGAFYGPNAVFGNAQLQNAGTNAPFASGDVFVASIGAGPVITGFTPTSGVVGTTITISGTNFTNVGAVTFGGVPATSYTVNTATSITATVPASALTGKIGVSAGGGSALSVGSFKVVPTLVSFAPAAGAPGDVVTLTGTGLAGTTSVKFNGLAANFSVISGTSVQATVPVGAKTGKISLTTAGGTVSSAGNFNVAPSISSFTPGSGAPGSVVVITGLNFVSGTVVHFNGTAASTTYNSTTQLTAVVPVGATSGPLTVTNANGVGTSGISFSITAGPAPTITTVTPMTGPVGASVTLKGTNLTGTTAIRLGNVAVTSYLINSATSITVTIPSGAITARFYVETPDGMAQSSVFGVIQPPTITAFSPGDGPVGTSVTITGTNFGGTTSVTFGGVAATSFTVNSPMQLTAIVPPGAVSGPISVTNPAGTASSAARFFIMIPRPASGTETEALVLYPNPAHDRLTMISAVGSIVELWNGQGYLVRTARLEKGELTLDLSGLPTGFYIVKNGSVKQQLRVE